MAYWRVVFTMDGPGLWAGDYKSQAVEVSAETVEEAIRLVKEAHKGAFVLTVESRMPLSARLRDGVGCSQWVIDSVKVLESRCNNLKAALRAVVSVGMKSVENPEHWTPETLLQAKSIIEAARRMLAESQSW